MFEEKKGLHVQGKELEEKENIKWFIKFVCVLHYNFRGRVVLSIYWKGVKSLKIPTMIEIKENGPGPD